MSRRAWRGGGAAAPALTVLQAVSAALARRFDLPSLAGATLSALRAAVDFDVGSLGLLTSRGTVQVHSWPAAPGAASDGVREVAQPRPTLERWLSPGPATLIRDARRAPGGAPLPFGAAGRSWLVVPLAVGRAARGFVALQARRPAAFSERHRRLLDALSGPLAVAAQSVQLFEQVRAGRGRLQYLSARLVEAQEAERRHMARELHDQMGQVLTGLQCTLEVMERLSPEAAPHAAQARQVVTELIGQVRELSLRLRPPLLDELGLQPALLALFRQFRDQTAIRIRYLRHGLERRFPEAVETAAFRIVQEALTNAGRHAQVDEVSVRVTADEAMVSVEVEDRGRGFDSDERASDASFGLLSMQERALLVGGRCLIESRVGHGTRVAAELPLRGVLERRAAPRAGAERPPGPTGARRRGVGVRGREEEGADDRGRGFRR